MKCIRCDHDSKYSERTLGTCPRCHHRFAFEPAGTTRDPLTDGLMKNAIEAVSAGGAVRFGVEHVYYEVCRRLHRKAMRGAWTGAGVVAGIGTFVSLASAPMTFLVWAGVFLWPLMKSGDAPLDASEFSRLWALYTEVHGVPPGAIVRKPATDGPYRGHHEPEPDLGDYSFDRAIICDRARTVDLLLANNFHFENSCAVLSIDGYPARAFKTVRAMLMRNPHLRVFALHDATWSGCTMATWLRRDADWFGGAPSRGVTITDIGLRPRDAKKLRGAFLAPQPGSQEPADPTLSSDDRRWLSRRVVELAAIRPERVLKTVFQAISAPARAASDGEGGGIDIWDSGSSDGGWGGDGGGGDDGGADGFG